MVILSCLVGCYKYSLILKYHRYTCSFMACLASSLENFKFQNNRRTSVQVMDQDLAQSSNYCQRVLVWARNSSPFLYRGLFHLLDRNSFQKIQTHGQTQKVYDVDTTYKKSDSVLLKHLYNSSIILVTCKRQLLIYYFVWSDSIIDLDNNDAYP